MESVRLKILGVGRREFLHAKMAQGETQADVNDPSESELFFRRPFPDIPHDRGGFDEPPVPVFPESLAIGSRLAWGHRAFENLSVAELQKNLDEHQFTDDGGLFMQTSRNRPVEVFFKYRKKFLPFSNFSAKY